MPVPEASEEDYRDVLRQLFERAAPVFFHDDHPEARRRLVATWLSQPYSVYRSTIDIPSPDLREVVPTLDTPTLVIVGGDSPSRPVEEAEWLCANMPRAELAAIPGTRHLMLTEEPGTVAARIEQFLAEALAGSGQNTPSARRTTVRPTSRRPPRLHARSAPDLVADPTRSSA